MTALREHFAVSADSLLVRRHADKHILDPVTFAAMPLLLAAAAVLASYLPARAASMVDPVETMRVE